MDLGKWAAPEVIQTQIITIKSEVYSFGVVLWELFTFGQTPYAEFTNQIAADSILKGENLRIPQSAPKIMQIIMAQCWARNPKHRPWFRDLQGRFALANKVVH